MKATPDDYQSASGQREGSVVYVLTLAMVPDNFTQLLQAHGLPADALSAIADRRGIILARSTKHEQFVGKPLPTRLREELATGDAGWGRGRTQDQIPVYRAWTRSPLTGWSTILGVTEASITRPIR